MAGVLGALGLHDRRADGPEAVDRPRDVPRWLDRTAVIVPLATLAAGAWAYRHVADDGFINLRVTAQLLAGNGPRIQRG